MNKEELKKIEKEHVMQTYTRFDIVLKKGEGIYVYDIDGKKYLDFIGGIATCSVGHSNKFVNNAISKEASKLISVSNLYYTKPQIMLAQKLSELTGLKKCFFCNSGAEANEAAIKLAKKITGKKEFIAFVNSFHGRTTGALSATWKVKFKEAFTPLAPDVKFAEYNNIDSLKKLITNKTAGVILEPIQGEAGVMPSDKGFLKEVRNVCNEKKIMMMIDEVQTGVFRTGKFFAFQHENILPDIVTTAKGLGNGVPIGVCISNFDFEKGDHASTFGGNNLSAAAANATIEYIEKNKLSDNAKNVGEHFMKKILELKKKKSIIKDVRGKGLMIGVVLKQDKAKEIVLKLTANGLLCNAAADDVIRFLPPLITTKKDVDNAIKIMNDVM